MSQLLEGGDVSEETVSEVRREVDDIAAGYRNPTPADFMEMAQMVRRAAGLTGPAPRSPDAPFWSLVAKALETEARRRLKLISSARHPSNEPRPEELRRTGTARVRALTRGGGAQDRPQAHAQSP